MDSKKLLMALAAGMTLSLATATSAFAVGGPVILGGDDLTSHGQVDGSGTSEEGWLYMEKAIGNIKSQVGRANNNTIAAFGSADPGPVTASSDGNAGAGIKNAAAKNGMSVQFFDTAAQISAGFASINDGSYRPAIVWIAGDDADNDIGDCEDSDPGNQTDGEAIAANANVINDFVNSGGGLMSHGVCYTWLAALLPGLDTPETGDEDDLFRTPAGQAAFPDVTDADFNAGPWHNHFEGDFGGLDVLVRSKNVKDSNTQADAAVVIGGGQVSLTEKPADLAITKSDSSDPSTAGRDLTYTLTVTNNGGNPATGVTVVDDLPSGVSARSSSASQGSCSGTTTVTCNLGDLGVGASATVRIVVRPGSAGTITNRARVSGNQPDPNESNNSASEETRISGAAAARRDRSAPRVIVAGVAGRGCVRRAFSAKFRIRESNLRSVSVFLDGKRVARTSKKLFSVRVPANRMKAGRHRLRVVAVDRSGNRRSLTRVFARCAQARAPVFTG